MSVCEYMFVDAIEGVGCANVIFFQVLCQAIEWKMRLLQLWVVVVEKSTENGS